MAVEQSYPLADFASHAREHVARLRATGQPETLISDDGAEVVVQDAAAYQLLLDRLDSLEATAAVRESVAEYGRGEGVAARAGFDALRGKHGIPRRA